MTKTIGNFEVTDINFFYENGEEMQEGILIHDLDDEFGNGDLIVDEARGVTHFKTEDEILRLCEDGTSYFEQDGDVYYMI